MFGLRKRRGWLWLAALTLVVGSGLARRHLSDDERAGAAVEQAASRLHLIPWSSPSGDWSGGEANADRRGLERAGIAGMVARRYENRRTGEAVTLVMVCGRSGPIAAHGPEACYPGLGYAPATEPTRVQPVGAPGALWSADFEGGDPGAPKRLRIAWGWSDGGAWSAPDAPRVTFAGSPVLWKLYLIRETTAGAASRRPDSADPALDLLAALLPKGPSPTP